MPSLRSSARLSLALSSLTIMLSLATGCSTSLTSMTDARAYKPGEVQAVVAYQGNVHSNVLGSLIDAAVSADEEFNKDSNEPISEESFRTWADTIIMASLFRPAMGPEIQIRAGVYDDFMEGIDLGFKTDLNILKFDAKLQLWGSEDGNQAFSTMLGYAHHLDVGNKIISYLTLTDFSRADFDLQFIYGYQMGDWLKLNIAPHIILSKVTPESKIPDWLYERLPDEIKQYDPGQFFKTEWVQYYGANIGLMLGYKYAFLATDLGMFYMNFKPTVVGQKRDYSGGAFSVALGISGHYAF